MTKEQCLQCKYSADIHYTGKHPCTRTIGKRGAVKDNITHVRQSGQVKTWKRSPERFHMPIKYGLYESWYIDETNCHLFHLASDCPLENGKE